MASVTLQALILADGFDLSPYLPSIDVEGNAAMLDSTVLGQTSNTRTFQPGLREHTVKGEAFFDYASITTQDDYPIDQLFADAMGASAETMFLIAPSGYTAIGDPCYILNSKQANYSLKETVGELIMLSFEVKATSANSATSGTFARGIILGKVTATTTGALTSYDAGASSVGFLAQCHVTSGVAVDEIIVKVQHSTDNSVWADLCEFEPFPSDGAWQAYATTTVNSYRRVNVTTFGTTESAVITVGFKSPYSI